jgi:hypothetical protein
MVTFRCSSPHLKVLGLVMGAAFLALAMPAQAQMFTHGPPASVTSPGPNGEPKGPPASVLSVRPPVPGVHPELRPVFRSRGPLHRFGSPRDHQRNVLVAVPVFYPIYYGEGNVADPYVPAQTEPATNPDAVRNTESIDAARASEDELRQAYLQGAREALAQERASNRNGQRSAEGDDRPHPRAQAADEMPRRKHVEEVTTPPKEDDSPTAVFIFKDGRKLETRNFAIMGTTLYDFSSNSLKKVPLADLDKQATLKENDDRGIQIKLP